MWRTAVTWAGVWFNNPGTQQRGDTLGPRIAMPSDEHLRQVEHVFFVASLRSVATEATLQPQYCSSAEHPRMLILAQALQVGTTCPAIEPVCCRRELQLVCISYMRHLRPPLAASGRCRRTNRNVATAPLPPKRGWFDARKFPSLCVCQSKNTTLHM